jgi:heme-degrading monooxygenase HmoA
VIVRISRSRYAPDDETDVFRSLQPLLDGRGRPPGLLDLVVGRRQMEDGRIEQTVITTWDSQADLAHGIEPAWDVPPSLDGAV